MRDCSEIIFIHSSKAVAFATVLAIAVLLGAGDGIFLSATSAQAEEEDAVSVPFITLRNKTGSKRPASYFGDKRDRMRAGYCDVARTGLDVLKPIAANSSFYVPSEVFSLSKVRETEVEDLWGGIAKDLKGNRPVLYTHGFFISFPRGCRRAALLQQSLELNGRMVLFSWPSDGGILSYARDESDLYWSVSALEETVLDMINRFGAGKFDLAAHSLGARGVFLTLIALAHTDHGDAPLINNVILFAPDIDAGIFAQYLERIRPLARKITVYASPNDQPLALSRQVHGYPRLGETGDHLNGLEGVEIIDLSDIAVQFPSGHVYHLYNKDVAADLARLLNDGKNAGQRENLKRDGANRWRLQPGAKGK